MVSSSLQGAAGGDKSIVCGGRFVYRSGRNAGIRESNKESEKKEKKKRTLRSLTELEGEPLAIKRTKQKQVTIAK